MVKDKKTKIDKSTPTTVVPAMATFRGIEEVKKVYRSMLKLSNKDIIYTFIDMGGVNPKLKKWLDKEFEPERVKRKISKQSFVTTKKIPKERWGYIQYDKPSYSAKYLVDPIDKTFMGEVSIFGSNVAFINFSSKQKMYAFVIEDKTFAQTMKAFYLHYVWKL